MKVFLGIIILSISLFANRDVAFIKSIMGIVEVKRGDKMIALKLSDKIYEKDIIFTKDNSNLATIFEDGSVVVLEENSILRIDKYIFSPSKNVYDFDVYLSKGKALFESGKVGKLAPQSVKFRIPQARVGIRGTKFLVEVHE